VAVYDPATRRSERQEIEARRKALIAEEDSVGFNPGRNAADLEVLKRLLSLASK